MSYEVTFWIIFVVLIYAIHLFTNKEESPVKEKKKESKKENYEEFILDVIKDMKNERVSLKDLGLSTEHKTYGSLYSYNFDDTYISEDNIVDYEGLVKYIAESKYNFGRWSKYISNEYPLHKNAKMNYYVIDLPFKRKSKEEKMIELMQVIVRIEKYNGFIFIDWYKDKDDDNLFHVKFKHSYDKKIYIKSGNISD